MRNSDAAILGKYNLLQGPGSSVLLVCTPKIGMLPTKLALHIYHLSVNLNKNKFLYRSYFNLPACCMLGRKRVDSINERFLFPHGLC